ncbi:MAG: hypothetical protein P1V21_01195 [Rhizobiaceae bacterium]|nr:hypothetical protein [Rhizobiaceae bacterium]
MDQQIIIGDYQEVPAEDFMRIQEFAQAGIDDLVKFAIHDGQAYGGFNVAASGPFEISVQKGLYFSAGKFFASREVLYKDLVEHQPVANKKAIAVIAWGSTDDQEPTERDFLVNVETEEVQVQQVNLVRARNAKVATVGGTESGDPQLPEIPLDRVLIATVIMTPTGIESVVMNEDADLSSTLSNDKRLNQIETWRTIAEPRISTIATDVANLSNGQQDQTSIRDFISLAADVARLKEASDIPDDYADYGTDFFLTQDESDVDNLEFLAKVEEGIRFSAANKNTNELELFSAINSHVTITNGFLLPKFTSELRLSVSGFVGEQSITQYTQTSFDVVRKHMSRQRFRWGQIYEYCTNSRFWKTGTYDPVSNIFTREGETFLVLSGNATRDHTMIRLQQYWVDTVKDPYWSAVETTTTIDGAQIAQTFLNSQAGWLTGVDLYFTKRGTSGNIFLTICELTPSGTPDLANAIEQKTIDYLDLNTYPQATTIDISPTYLQAGKRYGVVLTTQGNHYVAMADGGSYLSGTFFYSTDGAYFSGDITKDMMFGLRYARFSASRAVVDMQPINLDGGIAALDILASMVRPDACNITFQVELNTGWVPLSDIIPNALVGLPPLLPMQIVFQGTPDLHAGIMLTGSQISAERPRTTFKHISTQRVLATASDSIQIIWLLGNWNDAYHTFAASLDTPDGLETPDVIEDIERPGDMLQRTMTFHLPAPVPSFKIIAEGTTSTALDLFHVEERTDIEF